MSLEEIKAREAAAKEAIARGDSVVPVPRSFTMQQLGLQFVYADAYGHLWRVEGSKLIRMGGRDGPA